MDLTSRADGFNLGRSVGPMYWGEPSSWFFHLDILNERTFQGLVTSVLYVPCFSFWSFQRLGLIIFSACGISIVQANFYFHQNKDSTLLRWTVRTVISCDPILIPTGCHHFVCDSDSSILMADIRQAFSSWHPLLWLLPRPSNILYCNFHWSIS